MKTKKGQRGFTLVEVLVAVVLLMSAIVVVGSAFNYAINVTASTQARVAASNDAGKVMEEVRRVADMVGLNGAGSVSDPVYWSTWIQNQTYSNNSEQSVSVTFPDGIGQHPLHVMVQVSWNEKGATRQYELHHTVTPRYGT